MNNYSFHIVQNFAPFVAINDNQVIFSIEKQKQTGLYSITNHQNLYVYQFYSESTPIPNCKWKSDVVKITPKSKPKIRSLVIQLYNYLLCDQTLRKVLQSLNNFLTKATPSPTEKTVIVFSHPLVYCTQMTSNLQNDIINLLYKIKLHFLEQSIASKTDNIIFVQPTTLLEPWINVLPFQTNMLKTVDESYLQFITERSTKVSQSEYLDESKA